MDAAAKIPVSLPHPSPTISYWQDPPCDIADLRTTAELPAKADYVVIGSGITGASIAYNLLQKKPNGSVVMLEARQTCSGATGRNGGHTKASSYRTFPTNASTHSLHEATLIASLQAANITATHAFARAHNIPCDSHPCNTVDILYDTDQYNTGVRAIEQMNELTAQQQPGTMGIQKHRIMGKDEVREKYHCPDAVGGFEFEAGSISAYKFVVGMLKLALAKGLNLQTTTPATRLEPPSSPPPNSPSSDNLWRIHTPRGTITTPHAILATNGYTAALLPKFQGVIVPLRGQITAQRPGRSLPQLQTTYSFIYASGYEYMIPRPPGSTHAADIVIGGGWGRLFDAGAQEFGVTDDSAVNEEIGTHLRECTVAYFGEENWGEDDERGRVRREWTGIMGTSADGLPYVGRVPGAAGGLWVCASFDGHGMVLCLKCAEGLVEMMLVEEEEESQWQGVEAVAGAGVGEETGEVVAGKARAARLDEWFPRSFRLTEERFKVAFQGRKHAKMPVETMETRSHI